jgi:hypothetical protein
MAAATKGPLSKEFPRDKADSSAHRAGTTKESSSKSKHKAVACFLLKASGIATKASGRATFPTAKVVRPGQNLVTSPPMKENT